MPPKSRFPFLGVQWREQGEVRANLDCQEMPTGIQWDMLKQKEVSDLPVLETCARLMYQVSLFIRDS